MRSPILPPKCINFPKPLINYIPIVYHEYQKCHNYHTVGIVVHYVVYYALVVVNYVVGGVTSSAPPFHNPFTTNTTRKRCSNTTRCGNSGMVFCYHGVVFHYHGAVIEYHAMV